MNSSNLDPFQLPLSSDDFSALNSIKANDYSFVPRDQLERLISAGIVRETLAGLRLTDAGEIRVAAQK